MSHTAELLLLMWAAHGLCDYPLQGDWLAKAKNFKTPPIPGETIWPLAMMQHGLIHATAVFWITGRWELGALEYGAHILIDYAKCAGKIGYNTDQNLHLACKVLWVVILVKGWL